jgi:hypothetical protein
MGQILQDLSGKSNAELLAIIEAMKNAPSQRVTFKVSEKGCLSVYGLNTRGVHLYASQWERIAAEMPRLLDYIKTHPELARKQRD